MSTFFLILLILYVVSSSGAIVYLFKKLFDSKKVIKTDSIEIGEFEIKIENETLTTKPKK